MRSRIVIFVTLLGCVLIVFLLLCLPAGSSSTVSRCQAQNTPAVRVVPISVTVHLMSGDPAIGLQLGFFEDQRPDDWPLAGQCTVDTSGLCQTNLPRGIYSVVITGIANGREMRAGASLDDYLVGSEYPQASGLIAVMGNHETVREFYFAVADDEDTGRLIGHFDMNGGEGTPEFPVIVPPTSDAITFALPVYNTSVPGDEAPLTTFAIASPVTPSPEEVVQLNTTQTGNNYWLCFAVFCLAWVLIIVVIWFVRMQREARR
jgi:hypothetical protein